MADNLYYWENPAIIKENKEDAHVIALPYDSFEEALRRGESPYQKKLNGKWRFYWQMGVEGLPEQFQAENFDDSGWNETRYPAYGSCKVMESLFTSPPAIRDAIETAKDKIPAIKPCQK